MTQSEPALAAGRRRYHRIALYFLSAGLPRAIGLLFPLVMTPLALAQLGDVRFGLWMALTSLVAFMSFADLGLGSGVVNALATADGRGERQAAREVVSSALALSIAFAVTVLVSFVILQSAIDLQGIFGVAADGSHDLTPALALAAGCVALGLPIGIIQRTQFALQEGHQANLWEGLGKVAALGAGVVVLVQGLSLSWLVAVTVGLPLLALGAGGALFFRGRYRWLAPSWSFVRVSTWRQLLAVGLFFLLSQVALSVGRISDNLVIAAVLGPAEVTGYAVPLRLFEVVTVLVMMFSAALWPAYREALARRDSAWVASTLRRSVIGTAVVSVACCAILTWGGEALMERWLGSEVAVSMHLFGLLAVWTVLTAVGNVLTMFLFSVDAVRFQAIAMVLYALAAISVKLIVLEPWGVPALVLANIGAYGVCFILPCLFVTPRLIRGLQATPDRPRDPLRQFES